ncbi:MAG: MerR family transcriptional regulator [Chloroflexota bacterium]
MDDLLPIGRFARLTGLSVGALRHYDELGLLRPARVDPSSGYRSFRPDQVETGRTIARLRDLEVPLDEVRAIVEADDPGEGRQRLAAHRRRIEARVARLQRVLHVTGQLSQGKGPTVSESTTVSDIDPATHRQLGKDLFNHVWSLLETAERSTGQVDEMIHAAHAARYHWGVVGHDGNRARGEWQCSRVYAVLGRAEPALWHARRCVEIAEAGGEGVEDWDVAAAYEAMARASIVAGDAAAGRDWKRRAAEAAAGIADPDEREIIEGDVATLSV